MSALYGTLRTFDYAGDETQHCDLALFCDTDLAGGRGDCKNTRGAFLVVVGLSTYFALSALCKWQGSVSYSMREAEIAAVTSA